MVKVEIVAHFHNRLGENPLWDDRAQVLLWEDIEEGKLFRYSPATGKSECFYEGDVIGGFTMQEDGSLLLFETDRIVLLTPSGERRVVREEIDPDMRRFNDVIADPEGRVYAGTIGQDNQRGGLYRVDLDGTVTALFKGSGCANGMGFTLDRSTFYWTCSSRRKIFRFAYDAASGALKEQGVLHECTDDHQTPDGMTVDTAGHVWSARWGGQSVLELAADGTLLRTIEMPTSRITSAAFGGSDLEDLYCTSAGGSADDPSAAGALFRVSGTGARGMREFRSRVAI